MRFGVLGTGMVGQAIATKLVTLDHEVKMGSRQPGSEKAVTWAAGQGQSAAEGSFADAAEFGQMLFNATAGVASIEALESAGADRISNKVLIDVSNPIDPTSGMPPSLYVCNTDSIGERIQRQFPAARVVKTFNTMSADIMVNPGLLKGRHNVFLSGDDPGAKSEVKDLVETFGWPAEDIIDLGDISTARGPEMFLALWLRIMIAAGTAHFNIGLESVGA